MSKEEFHEAVKNCCAAVKYVNQRGANCTLPLMLAETMMGLSDYSSEICQLIIEELERIDRKKFPSIYYLGVERSVQLLEKIDRARGIALIGQ